MSIISISIPSELKTVVEREAESNGESLSAYLRRLIRRDNNLIQNTKSYRLTDQNPNRTRHFENIFADELVDILNELTGGNYSIDTNGPFANPIQALESGGAKAHALFVAIVSMISDQ